MDILNAVHFAQYGHLHLASEQGIDEGEGIRDDGLNRHPGNQVTPLDGSQIELRNEAFCVQFPIVNVEEGNYQTSIDHS
jgi:hypothetical protein